MLTLLLNTSNSRQQSSCCCRVESGSIKWIVRQISLLCKPLLSSYRDVGGKTAHLQQGKSPLWMSINDIQFVGIWGMGGVGKTIILVSLQMLKSAKILCTPCRNLGWFGNGSRITATTRDKHLIEKDDAVYEVTTFGLKKALSLAMNSFLRFQMWNLDSRGWEAPIRAKIGSVLGAFAPLDLGVHLPPNWSRNHRKSSAINSRLHSQSGSSV